jgi:hypothetical protein
MMADNQLLNNDVGGGDVFVYTGGERAPDVKRVRIAENIDTIPENALSRCFQLIEVEGHNKIKKIERGAFNNCLRLRRHISPTSLYPLSHSFYGKISYLLIYRQRVLWNLCSQWKS